MNKNGGGTGIRTPDTLTRMRVFKTRAFNHSAIPPRFQLTRILYKRIFIPLYFF